MKKVLIAMLVIAGIAGFTLKHKSTITYISGLVRSGQDRIGWVAGDSVFQLPVPWHRQEHALSCELASLKMALAGVGINVPESELINSLYFDPTVRSGNTWGDPYQGFVGNIDGQMSRSGYGVYWDPVARVGLRYARTQTLTNGSVQELLSHVTEGRPVVVWGYYGAGNRMAWVTSAGRTITAVHGEHARVVVGYTGAPENPRDIILLDPIYGELHWPIQTFMDNWTALERGAVVVYPQPRWVKTAGSNNVWEISSDNQDKYLLNMNWETFISGGGVGEGIAMISHEQLEQYNDRGEIMELN